MNTETLNNEIINFLQANPWIFFVLLWTLFWKGLAMWHAAGHKEKIWFIALLVVNTVGILDIIYLFWVAKKKWSDVKRVFLKIVLPKKKLK